jgi:hypothetical protein
MAQNTLIGWAIMPAATYSDGPTSGQFNITTNNSPANNGPSINKQPVQGFSAVLPGANGSYRFLVDNGYGSKANSPDSLLRMYALIPDFRTATGSTGTVSAADWNTGALRPSFDATTRITFNDPDHKLGFSIVAVFRHVPVASHGRGYGTGLRAGVGHAPREEAAGHVAVLDRRLRTMAI